VKELSGNSSGKLFCCGGRGGWRKRDSLAKKAMRDELRKAKEEVARKVDD
jgi:Fe-S oxidoreductase